MQNEIKKLLEQAGLKPDLIDSVVKLLDSFSASGRFRILKTRAGTGQMLMATDWSKNLVVTGNNTGRNLIAQRLGGTNTYSLNITHADIGTGTNTPVNTDTQLQTPAIRAALTFVSVVNNVVTLQFFFSDALLPNGTYTEAGSFVDGSATISTGQLFNRVLFGTPYVKATAEDTTLEIELNINSA